MSRNMLQEAMKARYAEATYCGDGMKQRNYCECALWCASWRCTWPRGVAEVKQSENSAFTERGWDVTDNRITLRIAASNLRGTAGALLVMEMQMLHICFHFRISWCRQNTALPHLKLKRRPHIKRHPYFRGSPKRQPLQRLINTFQATADISRSRSFKAGSTIFTVCDQ
jgi:hypothetical protein